METRITRDNGKRGPARHRSVHYTLTVNGTPYRFHVFPAMHGLPARIMVDWPHSPGTMHDIKFGED